MLGQGDPALDGGVDEALLHTGQAKDQSDDGANCEPADVCPERHTGAFGRRERGVDELLAHPQRKKHDERRQSKPEPECGDEWERKDEEVDSSSAEPHEEGAHDARDGTGGPYEGDAALRRGHGMCGGCGEPREEIESRVDGPSESVFDEGPAQEEKEHVPQKVEQSRVHEE